MMRNKKFKWTSIILMLSMLVSLAFTGLVKADNVFNNYLNSPEWIETLAEDYEISEEEVTTLYNSGMNEQFVRDYLDEKYPSVEYIPTVSDYIELSGEMNISRIDAVEAYRVALLYKKDPKWIAELFRITANWERVENALNRYYEINSQIAKEFILKKEGLSSEKISNILADIYRVNPHNLKNFLDLNGEKNISLISGVMFYLDLRSINELNIETAGIEELEIKKEIINKSLENTELENRAYSLNSELEDNYLAEMIVETIEYLREDYKFKSGQDITKNDNNNYMTMAAATTNPPLEAFKGALNYSEFSSPFGTIYGENEEDVDPSTGTLSISSTDFVLPGKAGMDFYFTRVFSNNATRFQEPDYVFVENTPIKKYLEAGIDYKEIYLTYTWKDGTYNLSIPSKYRQFIPESAYNNLQGYEEKRTEIFSYDAKDPFTSSQVSGSLVVEYSLVLYYSGNQTLGPYTYTEGPKTAKRSPNPSHIHVRSGGAVFESVIKNDAFKDPFGLGKGWTLNFPRLEIVSSSERYIHMDGSTYRILSTGALENMDEKRFTFESHSSIFITYPYRYSLTEINGIKYYFNEKGQLLGIRDKWNSTITFIYQDDMIYRIIDSVGRKIEFNHSPHQTTVSIYESEASFNPLQTWIYNKDDIGIENNYKLLQVVPPLGNEITYEYRLDNATFNSKWGDSKVINVLNLVSAQNSAGAINRYEYESYQRNVEDSSPKAGQGTENLTFYRISKRYTEVPSVDITAFGKVPIINVESEINFIYGAWNANTEKYSFTQIPVRKSGEMGMEHAITYFEFDSQRRNTLQKITGSNSGDNRLKTEETTIIYEYVGNEKRYSSVKAITSLSDLGQKESKSFFAWDEYGNIISTIDSLGNLTTYVYDNGNSSYNMLTEKKIYMNEFEGKKEVYTLDSSKKQIISKEEYMFKDNFKTMSWMVLYNRRISLDYTYINGKNVAPGEAKPGPREIVLTIETPKRINQLELNMQFYKGPHKVEYRKKGNENWTTLIEIPENPLYHTTTLCNEIFTLPELGFYEIKITNLYGRLNQIVITRINGYAANYEEIKTSKTLYTKYEYVRNTGNISAIEVYPFNINTGTPDTRTTILYDAQWNAYPVEASTQVTAADGTISTVKTINQYDALGRVTISKKEEIGKDSSQVSYEYDDLGRVTKVINPPLELNGQESYKTITYNDDQRQVTEMDELANDFMNPEYGTRIRSTYDGLGRVVYTEWQSEDDNWNLASYVKYDSLGRQISSFNADFTETRYEYDAFGRAIKTIGAYGTSNEIEVESWYVDVNTVPNASPSISLIPPVGFEVLELGGWGKLEDAEGNPSYVGYDVLGRTVWTANNPKNESGAPIWDMTWYEYDNFNRLTKVAINRTATDWDITEYAYEYNGQKTIFSSPLTMKLPGNVEPKYVYEYNSKGLTTKQYQENNLSKVTEMQYDEMGRLIKISYTMEVEYVNDSSGFNPTMVNTARKEVFYYNIYGMTQADAFRNSFDSNPESSIQMSYNPRGWLIGENWYLDNAQNPYTFSFEYDISGNLKSITYPDNSSISYIHDELGRLKKIPGFFENGDQPGFIYDNLGNLTDIYAINRVHTEYGYDIFGMVNSIQGTTSTSTVLSMLYEYTLNGYISKITDSSKGTPVALNYTYDGKGQLKTAEVNRETGMEKVSYNYDGANNRISESWHDSQQNLLRQYTYSYGSGSYLNSRNGFIYGQGYTVSISDSYIWDNYGQLNVKNRQNSLEGASQTTYIFDGRKNLNAVVEDQTVIEIYTYDALGRRLKVISTAETTINFARGTETGYEVKLETTTGNEISRTKYISVNGKYLAKVVQEFGSQEQKYFHHVDIVGSIRAITDINGNIVASYEYEPFGLVTRATGTDDDNLGFTGKRLDGTGLSYFTGRYYDAEIGRFISRDPMRSGRNWFVYCANNPLIYIDPTGFSLSLDGGAPSLGKSNPITSGGGFSIVGNPHTKYTLGSSSGSSSGSSHKSVIPTKSISVNSLSWNNSRIYFGLGSATLSSGALFAGFLHTADLINMTQQDIINSLPRGWSVGPPEYGGNSIIIKDTNNIMRIRIDPPDPNTPYDHTHLYDENGHLLDRDLKIVSDKNPRGHQENKGPNDPKNFIDTTKADPVVYKESNIVFFLPMPCGGLSGLSFSLNFSPVQFPSLVFQ